MHRLGALRARYAYSRFGDFHAEVLLEAGDAGAVAAPRQLPELLGGEFGEAQGALHGEGDLAALKRPQKN